MKMENGLDDFVHPMFENLGVFAAENILKLMANQLQPSLAGYNLGGYSALDLMTKDLPSQSWVSYIWGYWHTKANDEA